MKWQALPPSTPVSLATGVSPELFVPVRTHIERLVAEGEVPSIAVAVAHDGEIIWEDGFGLDDRGNNIPASEHTLYALASISKPFAAAGQFCLTDARCKAGINLTGFMYGDIVDINLVQPTMFVSEEELWCRDCYVNDLFYKRTENNAYQMKIRGAKHASFGDPCLWGGLFKILGDQATIDGERMAKIQNVYTLAFFDTHLRNLASPLLDGPSSDYPEVAFRSHHP